MKNFILLVLFPFFAAPLIGCRTPQGRSTQSPDEIKDVSVVLLSQPAWAAQYEKQKVRVTAKFERISSEFGIVGLEHYQFTHFLVSLVSADEKASLYALIPAYSEILPTIRPGDLVKIEGIPYIGKNDYVYLLVTNLNKL